MSIDIRIISIRSPLLFDPHLAAAETARRVKYLTPEPRIDGILRLRQNSIRRDACLFPTGRIGGSNIPAALPVFPKAFR